MVFLRGAHWDMLMIFLHELSSKAVSGDIERTKLVCPYCQSFTRTVLVTYIRCVPRVPQDQKLWVRLCSRSLLYFRTTSRRVLRRVRASFLPSGGVEAVAVSPSRTAGAAADPNLHWVHTRSSPALRNLADHG